MKTAIITGASTGIGRATAIELAKHGYIMYLLGRNEFALQKTATKIEELQGKAEVVHADLSDINSINEAVTKLKSKVTQLDALINIAGIWHGKDEVYAGRDFETFQQQVILDTLTVGLTAPTILAHAFLPLMKKNSKIVNLSGTFENGAKGWLPYYVSKRAIEDLTIALAQELEEKGIQVNCVSPSDTATSAYNKYFPQYMEDAIAPELIAQKIVELCKEENTTSGKVIVMKKDTQPTEAFHS